MILLSLAYAFVCKHVFHDYFSFLTVCWSHGDEVMYPFVAVRSITVTMTAAW